MSTMYLSEIEVSISFHLFYHREYCIKNYEIQFSQPKNHIETLNLVINYGVSFNLSSILYGNYFFRSQSRLETVIIMDVGIN